VQTQATAVEGERKHQRQAEHDGDLDDQEPRHPQHAAEEHVVLQSAHVVADPGEDRAAHELLPEEREVARVEQGQHEHREEHQEERRDQAVRGDGLAPLEASALASLHLGARGLRRATAV